MRSDQDKTTQPSKIEGLWALGLLQCLDLLQNLLCITAKRRWNFPHSWIQNSRRVSAFPGQELNDFSQSQLSRPRSSDQSSDRRSLSLALVVPCLPAGRKSRTATLGENNGNFQTARKNRKFESASSKKRKVWECKFEKTESLRVQVWEKPVAPSPSASLCLLP